MDNTRTFLLNEMAGATNLPDFYLAFRALQNLNQLVAQMPPQMAQQPVAPQPQPPGYGYGVGNQRFYGPGLSQMLDQQGPQQPRGPQPYNPASEPSWGENDERMPWEGE